MLDPTAGRLMRSESPRVCAWCERMLDPPRGGTFEEWAQLAPTLEPFLASHVALFLQWSAGITETFQAPSCQTPNTRNSASDL